MKLKKAMSLGLAGMMVMSMAACGNAKDSGEKTADGKEKQKLVIWSWGRMKRRNQEKTW